MLDPDVATTGAEPAYCPACQLRHTRRPDWLCPRCGMPVEPGVGPPRVARSPAEEPGFPAGARIAGAVLVVSGAALATAWARAPAAAQRGSVVAAAAVVVALGLGALLGGAFARWAAAFAAIAGAAVLAEDLVRVRLPGLLRDPVPPAARAVLRGLTNPLYPAKIAFTYAFVAGILLLVAGRPRRVRIAAGVLLALPLVVLQAFRAWKG
ncbi:MAG TPA: hypothetical protein VF841_11870 [Anaeromyxobacter sp.]